MLDSLIPPLPSVAAYIVSEHILLPATIYVDVHGTYCRRTVYIVADNICWVLRHILSPVGTYCRLSSHIVAGDSVCRNRRVCLKVGGGGGGGGGGGAVYAERQQYNYALNVVVYCRRRSLLSLCIYFVYI